MKVTRLYTGKDKESHFEDIDIPIDGGGKVGKHSKPIKVSEISFIESFANSNYDWHPAPRRQIVITLEGKGEIEVGDGTVRTFGPGDVMFAEDTTGHGHISRVPDSKPRRMVFIPLD